MTHVDNRAVRFTFPINMIAETKSTLAKMAVALSLIWLVLWLGKKFSGTTFLVCVLGTYICYQALILWFENGPGHAKLAYATAGRNERANQYLLSASFEHTRQARWKFWAALMTLVVAVVKFLPLFIHWLHQISLG